MAHAPEAAHQPADTGRHSALHPRLAARAPQAGRGSRTWLRLRAIGLKGAPCQIRPAATTRPVAAKADETRSRKPNATAIKTVTVRAQAQRWPAKKTQASVCAVRRAQIVARGLGTLEQRRRHRDRHGDQGREQDRDPIPSRQRGEPQAR